LSLIAGLNGSWSLEKVEELLSSSLLLVIGSRSVPDEGRLKSGSEDDKGVTRVEILGGARVLLNGSSRATEWCLDSEHNSVGF
jgi:hypothetical protein